MTVLKSRQARPGHAAGIYSDNTLDGPEIGTLVAVVDRAKNLPNRKTMGKQDPYCAMRLAKEAKKTNTDRRGGQTPRWDQELRFTVHDSPDYYKLKCSIFNDDKKTELIAETWIDLVEVIKLGGGQSDQWHQLNFKGKYAGDVRVELTFYDTRERPQEQKKAREPKSQPAESSSDISLPAQRSFGPREIRKRPLPASPAASAPAQSSPAPAAEQAAPQLPAKIPIEEYQSQHQQQSIHAPVPTRPRGRQHEPESSAQYPGDLYDKEPSQHLPDQDHQPHHHRISSHSIEPHQQPWQYPLGQQYRDYQPNPQCDFRHASQQELVLHNDMSMQAEPEPVYPSEQEIWQQQQQQRPQSMHMHSEPVTPQHSEPAYRPTPTSANSDTQLVRFHQQRIDDAATRTPQYVDSPLRQSMSQQDAYHHPPQADVPPPLPPKHRDTPPRRPRSEYPPSAYIPQPLRIGVKRTSLSDRSPLQSLEDDYFHSQDAAQTQTLHTPQPQRHSMYVSIPPEHQENLQTRRSTQDMQPYVSDSEMSFPRHPPTSRRNSYEIRSSSFSQRDVVDEPQAMTPDGRDQSGHNDAYQASVEDAPPSPGPPPQPVIYRKAVGASPKKLNGVPFGPDAYDVLNPASSPVTNDRTVFQTPEQAKEAQRLREVEKLRDIGPIIGNDGREIDPSDHLPSDTWAPEPERKQRKPEHVIHIRSKNDRPAGARASPIVIRHHGASGATQSSPAPAVTPPAASSPATNRTPNSFIGGRNRLQKPMPASARTLPTQPYSSPAGAATSSPVLATSPQQTHADDQYARRPSQQRRPSYDNRVPSHITRPALSEYQVPVGNGHAPYSGSYDNGGRQLKAIDYVPYDNTPTKQLPQAHNNYSSPVGEYNRRSSYDNRDRRDSYDRRSDYSYENHPVEPQPSQEKHFDDPLAAEMSLIDIGPSRHSYHQGSLGRSMVRRW